MELQAARCLFISWLEKSSQAFSFTNFVLSEEKEEDVVMNESTAFTSSLKFILKLGQCGSFVRNRSSTNFSYFCIISIRIDASGSVFNVSIDVLGF